ncbi:MAG: DoxX family protein [Cytophagales bacterium]|nr:DoxX family protein [Cytophagales bacterium]
MKKITQLGKWFFVSVFAVFGFLHFGPLEFSLPYIPSYLPYPAFWVYFSGAGLVAFSVSAWVGKLDKLAALLLALMLFLFIVMIHIPGAIQGDFIQLIGIFRDTAMMGAALMYADRYAKDSRYVG